MSYQPVLATGEGTVWYLMGESRKRRSGEDGENKERISCLL